VFLYCRSHWPHGLRRRSSAARLLRLWVRIPPGAWMFVCCECRVLSRRGLCDDGLITRPEESYRPWRVVVCDQETSKTRRLPGCENATTMGCNARKTNERTKERTNGCSFVTPAAADNGMAFLVHDLSAAVFGRGAIICLGRAQSVEVSV